MSRLSRLMLVCAIPLLAACASLDPQQMVTEETSFGTQHPVSVGLAADGGSSGVEWYSGTIPADALLGALRQSIEKTGLFAAVVDPSVADYVLALHLAYAGSHPGANMNAWVNTDWSLVQRTTQQTLWSSEVKGEGRATFGESFNGAKRQFMALERAARSTIDQALTAVAALELAET